MRKRIYEVIDLGQDAARFGVSYDVFMLLSIFMSLIPLAFKETNMLFKIINILTCTIFLVDYILRVFTADYRLKKGKASFIIYPFTGWAIIDLLSILSYISYFHVGLRLLRVIRFIRLLRIFRAFRAFRYSKSIQIILKVASDTKESLVAVVALAIGYILISALLVFNVEPDTFDSFFEAVYWATISLTTVGYGDIYPVSNVGRMVTMISSLFGVAVIALPAGIITAGYMDAIRDMREKK